METIVMEPEISASMGVHAIVESSEPWWPTALAMLFWAGVAFVIVRVAVSIVSIMRIARPKGCKHVGKMKVSFVVC